MVVLLLSLSLTVLSFVLVQAISPSQFPHGERFPWPLLSVYLSPFHPETKPTKILHFPPWNYIGLLIIVPILHFLPLAIVIYSLYTHISLFPPFDSPPHPIPSSTLPIRKLLCYLLIFFF